MTTRVLIINRQLVFAVTLKQALEQTGRFDVHPFTTAEAAFDYLREHPQDVALVDFTLPGRSGARVVQQLRNIQSDLAVIISPRQPDGDAVLRSLGLQGVIDMPFTARDVIPMIERAIGAAGEPLPLPGTGQLDAAPPQGQTRILDSDVTDEIARRRAGTTGNLTDPSPEEPAQTRILSENPPAPPENFGKTRIFDDEPPSPSSEENVAGTRVLDEDAPQPKPPPASYQTRILDDEAPIPPPKKQASAKTRILDEGPAFDPKTRDLSGDTGGKSRLFETPPPPPDLPEFSSLDNVLKSFGFDPPPDVEDTPSVPEADSDALRQYLATSPETGDSTFDSILSEIKAEDAQPSRSRRDDEFEGLVKSLSNRDPQSSLRERRQMDFVFTSGMDSLLREIEKTKTGPLPPDAATLQKLAEEEPPMPTLDEGGTVSDLMLGVSDRGFRNVLAMLRGEEIDEVEASGASDQPVSREEAYAAFFGSVTGRETLSEEQEDPAQIRSRQRAADVPHFDFDATDETADEEATVAQVILKTALDDTTLPGGFSINRLMSDIENRLSMHKFNIRPLPSWDMDTGAFRTATDPEVKEPPFLPEEFPPGENITALPELGNTTTSFTGRTTRPSPATLEATESEPEEVSTARDSADYLQPTMPVAPGDLPEADFNLTESTQTSESIVLPPDVPEMETEYDLSPEETPEAVEPVAYDTWDMPPAEAPELAPPVEDLPAPVEDAWSESAVEEAWEDEPEAPVIETSPQEDAYIAQLALHLTQVSLELSAEGTLLTREGEIVGYAGHLLQEDALELNQAVANDWDANPEGARVRFITLPSSGKEYMLYSIRTENNLTLSMIFAGSTPLRVIRQQGQRLAQALESVPEVVEEPPAPEPPPAAIVPAPDVPVAAYSYLWMLDNPDAPLDENARQAISAGLTKQLRGWVIQALQVDEDYVYLLADVPGETPSQEVMRDLKQRSAELVHAVNPDVEPDRLWADGYFILTPGRELSVEEIQEFINFQRSV
jgi:DNA-binding NarL/FixJ family response regulator/REP element-mobilizing transposase RayT